MILAGDIGGTKTVLAIYQAKDSHWQCLRKQQFDSNGFPEFDDLLNEFVCEETGKISAACIGVAGPVINGDCVTTNLPWSLKAWEIGKVLDTSRVKMLNDLEAAAWGVPELDESEIASLNPHAEKNPVGHMAVIAAGTGLGEAVLFRDGEELHAMATEGGHTDFAANSEQEDALLQFLRTKYPEHVSYERVVSGEGLVNIYQFLKNQGGFVESQLIEQQLMTEDPASVIGKAGVAGKDGLCVEALKLFCKIYGAEAGNLALNCLPYGGIYLAGGIGPKILPRLQKGEFMEGFLNKGRYRDMLEKIPVKVCLNPEVAISGALKYAVTKMVNPSH